MKWGRTVRSAGPSAIMEGLDQVLAWNPVVSAASRGRLAVRERTAPGPRRSGAVFGRDRSYSPPKFARATT
jgi:hypothetical protein